MVALNFCTSCGEKKVKDVKEDLERLFTLKVFSPVVCSVCRDPIPSASNVSDEAPQEQPIKDSKTLEQSEGDSQSEVEISLKTGEAIKKEPDLDSLDEATGDDLWQPDDADPMSSEDEESGDDKVATRAGTRGVSKRKSVAGKKNLKTASTSVEESVEYVNRVVDEAQFKLTALKPQLSEMIEIVNNDKFPYKCKQCKKGKNKFNGINYLVVHLAKHLGNNELSERPYQCNKCCDKQFKTILKWSHHVNVFQCRYPFCRKRFQSRSSFRAHENSHSKSDGKPFKCSKCNKSFLTSGNLTGHMNKIHTLRKPAKVQRGDEDDDEELHEDLTCNTEQLRMAALRPEIAKCAEISGDEKLPYKCKLCEKTKQFSCINYLVYHLSSHSSDKELYEKPYRCNTCCEMQFKTLAEWSEHTRIYKCGYPSCGMKFETRKSLTEHEKSHNGTKTKPHKCSHCKSRFTNKDNLLGHIRKKHCSLIKRSVSGEHKEDQEEEGENQEDNAGESEERKQQKEEAAQIRKLALRPELKELLKDDEGSATSFQCKNCDDLPEKSVNYFITHAQIHVDRDIIAKPFQCTECCSEMFDTLTRWKSHVRPHKCHIHGCTFRAHNKFKLNEHVKHVHFNIDRKFKCKKCPKSFHTNYALNSHIKVVHDKVKRFTCSFCGFQFFQRANLTKHERRHTKETPFPCEVCGKRFSTARKLKIHNMDHTGERPFVCDQCGFATKTKPDLLSHQKTHARIRPYQCEICGLQMSTKSWVDRHARKHTGEKVLKCKFCDEYFMYASTRESHERRHPEWKGVRKYICDVCGQDHPSNNKLQRHRIIHTGEKPFHCSKCSFRTNRESSLNVHQKTHERNKTSAARVKAAQEQKAATDIVPGNPVTHVNAVPELPVTHVQGDHGVHLSTLGTSQVSRDPAETDWEKSKWVFLNL